MTPVFEQVLSQAKALPLTEQFKLASLLVRQSPLASVKAEDRRAAFRRIRGKYKHLLSSVDEFLALKREEVELEERKFEERQQWRKRQVQ